MTSENEICAHCQNFKMKDYPEHARAGLGRCMGYDGTRAPLINPFVPWTTPACGRFLKATDMAKRVAWVEKRQGKAGK